MKPRVLLKTSFIIGAIADAIIAINWFMISLGVQIPSIISNTVGNGRDYQFAMFISALFMLGWSIILLWGWFKPEARKDLLIITAGMLLLSIIMELFLFIHYIPGPGLIMGILFRLLLIGKFTFSYFFAKKTKLSA